MKAKWISWQWAPKVIDVGVHRCIERSSKGKLVHFWYAYDLTAYHVAQGDTALQAINSLMFTLWATELGAAEDEAKGQRVTRERVHLRCKDAIPELEAGLKKWNGYRINAVEWRKWSPFPWPKNKKALKLMGFAPKAGSMKKGE